MEEGVSLARSSEADGQMDPDKGGEEPRFLEQDPPIRIVRSFIGEIMTLLEATD